MRAVLVGLALLAATRVAPSFAGEAIRGTFRLGPTGIYCIKAPCPWRGIMKLDDKGHPEGKPLWTGDELLAIDADPGVRDRILSTWKASGCLVVEGKLSTNQLFVSRIAGGC